MNRQLNMKCLILFLCSFNFATVFSQSTIASLYPVPWKADCVFPFTYQGKNYTDCTIDGDNGDIPWCSMTLGYKGLITYCFDFRKTTLQCLPSFTMPNGKVYTSCDFLSTTATYKQCKTNNTQVKYRYCTDAISSTQKITFKHLTGCDPAYAVLAQDHTMCYGPSPYAFFIPLTDTEKQDLLDIHNSYRAAVPSKYMFKLAWDDELAKLAQAHAGLCIFEHDLAVNRRSPKYNWLNGQNLVMSSEIRTSPAGLIDLMLGSEKPYFQYGKGCSPGDNTCLHYTQAMLSNLTRVGCGQTHCIYPDRIERYVTCNYIQSQYDDNYQTPYLPSDHPAANCPGKASNGLCDCGNKICAYDKGEYLEPNTCKCIPPVGKRSIEKRSSNRVELPPAGKRSIDKRSSNRVELPSTGKRSVREVDVNDAELDGASEHYANLPSGKSNTASKSKRDLTRTSLNNVVKRNSPRQSRSGYKN